MGEKGEGRGGEGREEREKKKEREKEEEIEEKKIFFGWFEFLKSEFIPFSIFRKKIVFYVF